MTHNIVPYEGNDAYIFVSYAHKDKERVFPIIETMQGAGYRVWYDQGIDPGTEWDENIAGHVTRCSFFIAFISQSYLESDNCKDELNYARELSKDRVLVYLEEVTLPEGMQMRLGRQQAIYFDTYLDNMQMFYDTLFKSNGIACCFDQVEKSDIEEEEVVNEQINSTKWLFELAEKGDVTAQVKLGVCYATGDGVLQDNKKAVEYFEKAAKQGDVEAQINMGVSYSTGNGVPQDQGKAFEWFLKAAEQGNTDALVRVGLCFAFGMGVEQDYDKAAEFFQTAANQEDPNAEANLGTCYRDGLGVDCDMEKAVMWYQKAAEQGHLEAQNNLGQCYMQGKGVEQNYENAVAWFTKAAEQGNLYACFNVGLCYENGWGVDADYKMAAKWYEKAAEQGEPNAQQKMVMLHDKGLI